MKPQRLAVTVVTLACAVTLSGCSLPDAAAIPESPGPVIDARPARPHGQGGPKNVIIMIGDGMGFNQIDLATLYADGTSFAQVAVNPETDEVDRLPSVASTSFQSFPVRLAMRTTAVDGDYDPDRAWSEFSYVRKEPTDSAAAGTAMATGLKTYHAAIGVDPDGDPALNLAERAIATGRKAGVVSTVPFSHATPGSFSAHEVARDNYRAIAHDQIHSDLSVIIGAGHPWFTDDHETRARPDYTYMSEGDYDALVRGSTGFAFYESTSSFEQLAQGETPERVFGIPQVASTLQQRRTGTSRAPLEVPLNAVPDLQTLTRGALNVLDSDPDGFFLMVEGGAIDWTNHDNQTARSVEETLAFFDAVETVNAWVDTNSSWEETLVIVTADHESGYLTGPAAGPGWTPILGEQGTLPDVAWNSSSHTNQLVPFFAKGRGSDRFDGVTVGNDPVRGAYLDNTSIAQVVGSEWTP